ADRGQSPDAGAEPGLVRGRGRGERPVEVTGLAGLAARGRARGCSSAPGRALGLAPARLRGRVELRAPLAVAGALVVGSHVARVSPYPVGHRGALLAELLRDLRRVSAFDPDPRHDEPF